MALPLKIKIRGGYFLAFLLLVISYFLTFFSIRKVVNETGRVTHSYSVINNLESIKSNMAEAETGLRGYIITNDERFLEPYDTASEEVLVEYAQLLHLTADNAEFKTLTNKLGDLINRKLIFMSDGLKQFKANGFIITDKMKVSREPSKNAMDSIRLLVKQLQGKEDTLMKKRDDKLQSFFNATEIIAITSLIVALIIVIYSVIVYNHENKAKETADANARIYSKELEERVNELNKANAELKELRSIEKFAATGRIARTIAHEVRNPLTNISLAAEQIKELIDQNEEIDLLMEMVTRNATRINQLISELLNSTRFGQLEYTQEDLNGLLDEALEQARDRIELKQVKVEKYYQGEMYPVMVDREKIKLAFLNIIVNAIEAMEKGSGLLQIRTFKMGDKCMVEIKDNGTGMDDETLQKLFEPYFTSKMKGNGLGLTNTQNIILNHKGNIRVTSKPGQGSTFIIMLALHDEVEE